jgi:Transcriptional regulator
MTPSDKSLPFHSKYSPKKLLVIKAAQESFLRHGFEKTSMDMLADQAGVARRTIYNQFASKEALFQAVVENVWSHLTPPELTENEKDIEPTDRLRRMGMIIALYWAPPVMKDFLRLILLESERFPFLQQDFYQMSKAPIVEQLNVFFDELCSEGIAAIPDIELAARQFVGLIMEPLLWLRLVGVGDAPTDERCKYVAEEAVNTFIARYWLR